MALSGLDIYKHLPKTNCKKCGFPTCLAFAMALAQKKVSLEKCPDVTDEAKKALELASAPPMATVTVGTGEKQIEIGGETVLFRHEKTFFHPPAFAITVKDTLKGDQLIERIRGINELKFERVGNMVEANLISIVNESNDATTFATTAQTTSKNSPLPLMLMSDDARVLEGALKICGDKRPLIYAAQKENIASMVQLARQYSCPLAIHGKGLEEVASLTQKASAEGLKDLVIDFGSRDALRSLEDFTRARRLSLKKNVRSLGYPIIAFAQDDTLSERIFQAVTYICKYASIVVLDTMAPEELLPLVTLRLNIYTDPQKPITMEPKIYEIGTPTKDSPVLVTTNFSLTFFTVQPEVESSKIASFLLIVDSEGMSVLTAWAAEKFTAEQIAAAMKKWELEKMVSHRKIIIPGYVSVLSGKLEEESGWKVLVGPKEASGIPKYLKEIWK